MVCHHYVVSQPHPPHAGPPHAEPPHTENSSTERAELRRPASGYLISGVCLGIADHLQIDVRQVRILTVLLALAGGLGVVAYIFLWVTVPIADGTEQSQSPLLSRLVKAPNVPTQPGENRVWYARFPIKDIVLGALLLGIAILLVASRFGFTLQWTWVFSTFVVVAGLGLAWSQLDASQRGELVRKSGGKASTGTLRLVGGLVLVTIGVLLLTSQEIGGAHMMPALLAALAVLLGVGLVLAPWWLRLVNQLGQERAAKEREATRADIAAHLHDSVLQTLALIQRSADAPGEVTRLARNQERELRQWLYNDRQEPGTSLAQAARQLTAEVENTMTAALSGQSSVSIDLVVVGDCAPDENTEALLAATGEALKNAVRHGKPPVSAYLEVAPEQIEVFVTDRGSGFDLDAIASDRFGVRQSIIGRIQRRGGTATIRRLSSGGTEVALRLPRLQTEHPTPAEKDQV